MNSEKIIVIMSKLEKIKTLIKSNNIYDANKKYKKLLTDEKYEEIFSSGKSKKSENMPLEDIEKLREYLINLIKNMPSAPNFSLVNDSISSVPRPYLFDNYSNGELVFKNINQLVNSNTEKNMKFLKKCFHYLNLGLNPLLKI